MTINEVLTRTDWAMLRDQKETLLRVLNGKDPLNSDHPELSYIPEHLEGLLNWIDALQDAAEAEGYPVEWLTEG